jgi:hypothetical protein
MRILQSNNKKMLLNSFPSELSNDVEIVVDFLNEESLKIHAHVEKSVFINNQTLIIPRRIYTNIPKHDYETNLTEKQNLILNCLYLTHHDGFLRQKRLELLRENYEYFVIPYKIKVLSEYIIEIIIEIEQQINENTIEYFLKFIDENPQYWSLVKSRIISYWGEYFRWNCIFENYIGYNIIKKLEMKLIK